MLKIIENKQIKRIVSPNYNLFFNKETGFTARWGKDFNDDPPCSPLVEIADIEISEGGMNGKDKCLGKCGKCYKKNNLERPSTHMTLQQFQNIVEKLGPGLQQIALGLTNISANPDFWAMCKWAKDNGIICNYTCHGLDVTPKIAQKTKELCGAVAVSIVNREKSYNAIQMFTNAGMDQVNIHFVLANETYEEAFRVIKDCVSSERLKKLNAIVFLAYKNKGNNPQYYTSIKDQKKYQNLYQYCEQNSVQYGMDSCSGPRYLENIRGHKNEKQLAQHVETCCVTRFSAYINCKGEYFPCSFLENSKEDGWTEGINVLECEDFYQDVWNTERVNEYRKHVLANPCPCSFDL